MPATVEVAVAADKKATAPPSPTAELASAPASASAAAPEAAAAMNEPQYFRAAADVKVESEVTPSAKGGKEPAIEEGRCRIRDDARRPAQPVRRRASPKEEGAVG